MTLNGQRIVVIGGSSGMGLATARAAALAGAEVTIASSRRERIDAALSELPDGCVGAALDVRDETQVAGVFERSASSTTWYSPQATHSHRVHSPTSASATRTRASRFASGAPSPSSSTPRPGSGPEDRSG